MQEDSLDYDDCFRNPDICRCISLQIFKNLLSNDEKNLKKMI